MKKLAMVIAMTVLVGCGGAPTHYAKDCACHLINAETRQNTGPEMYLGFDIPASECSDPEKIEAAASADCSRNVGACSCYVCWTPAGAEG